MYETIVGPSKIRKTVEHGGGMQKVQDNYANF